MNTHPDSRYLEQELRSDHAGEVGAVAIYRGIKAVALWRGDHELMRFADAHGAVEQEHLTMMNQLVPASQQSKLQTSWRIAGWLTGAVPALFGRNTVYATIQAVETFVNQHYQQQIDQLAEYRDHNKILEVLIKCQADEIHHRDDAGARVVGSNPLLTAWCGMIGIGSKVAVAICRKI
jgi:ubiquinone biosynthesis monooxygenase Coq7